MNDVALIAFTERGCLLAKRLAEGLSAADGLLRYGAVPGRLGHEALGGPSLRSNQDERGLGSLEGGSLDGALRGAVEGASSEIREGVPCPPGRNASAARSDGSFPRVACTVSGPARFADELGIRAYDTLANWTSEAFATADALVFVGAAGIAVRAIAPHVRDKFSDPAVVSVDEAGLFAVPLLSGHVGGANELARAVARICGGQAAVSTATDVNGLFAVDEWAARRNLAICERALAKDISARLLEGGAVGFAADVGCRAEWELPNNVVVLDGRAELRAERPLREADACSEGRGASALGSAAGGSGAAIPDGISGSGGAGGSGTAGPSDAAAPDSTTAVGCRRASTSVGGGLPCAETPDLGFAVSLDEAFQPFERTLHLVPRCVTVGVGCRRGTAPDVLAQAVESALADARVSPRAVTALASIDVKRDEPAILELAAARGWDARFYTADELAAVPGEFAASDFVKHTVGVDNVCERAALADGGRLLVGKQAGQGVTVALAMREPMWEPTLEPPDGAAPDASASRASYPRGNAPDTPAPDEACNV